MNKNELILRIAEETTLPRKTVEIALNATFNQITQAMAEGERVQIVGFGSFETKTRAERIGWNCWWTYPDLDTKWRK